MSFARAVFLAALVTVPAGVHGEQPKRIKAAASMTTRVFKAPCGLQDLGTSYPEEKSSTDPFAQAPHRRPQGFWSTQEILQEMGLRFPPGSSAVFDQQAGEVTIHGTEEMHDLAEAIFESFNGHGPLPSLGLLLTVVEGPGEIIRKMNAAASRGADTTPALLKLLEQARLPGTAVRVVGDAFVDTQLGVRTTTEAVRERAVMADAEVGVQERSLPASGTRSSTGLALEFEPSMRSDGHTIDLTFGLNFHAEPQGHPPAVADSVPSKQAVLPAATPRGTMIATSIGLPSGGTSLVSVTKPSNPSRELADAGAPDRGAAEDVLWAVFVTAKLRPVHLPRPPAQPLPPDLAEKPVPAGMQRAAFHAPVGLLEACIDAPGQSLRDWLVTKNIAFPTGAGLERRGDLLWLTNTTANIERFAAAVSYAETRPQRTAAFTLHTLEAPATLLRDLARQRLNGTDADDGAMLESVQAAVARGEASYVSSVFLETKDGVRASHESGIAQQHVVLARPETAKAGAGVERSDDKSNDPEAAEERPRKRVPFELSRRNAGVRLDIEPQIRWGGNEAQVIYSHELHAAGPETRRERMPDPATQQPLDMPVTDFQMLRTTSTITARDGSTRLVSLHSPQASGLGPSDKLWATFLQCHLVPQISPPHPAAAAAAAAETRPSPQGSSPGTESQKAEPKELVVRWMKVPPDFLELNPDFAANAPDLAAVAKANGKTSETSAEARAPKLTTQEILEKNGIQFPQGASALFIPETSTLIVRNTRSNLDMVEAFTDSIGGPHFTPTLAFTTHVLEGPGTLLRRLAASAAAKINHRGEMEEALAAVKAGTVRILSTARVETKPGVHTKMTEVEEHFSIDSITRNAAGALVFQREPHRVGLSLELETTLASNRTLIDVTLGPEFHTAPPTEHQEHVIDAEGCRLEFPLVDYHRSSLVTGLTMPDGSARLLHLWKPAGKPKFEKADVLQVMFLTADILLPEE